MAPADVKGKRCRERGRTPAPALASLSHAELAATLLGAIGGVKVNVSVNRPSTIWVTEKPAEKTPRDEPTTKATLVVMFSAKA